MKWKRNNTTWCLIDGDVEMARIMELHYVECHVFLGVFYSATRDMKEVQKEIRSTPSDYSRRKAVRTMKAWIQAELQFEEGNAVIAGLATLLGEEDK